MLRLAAVLCFVTVGTPAWAGECPVRGPEEKLQIVAAAPSCAAAVRLFKLCATGASFDGRLAVPVHENCEGRFLAGLSPDRRKAYETELDACNAKYAKRRGTMHRSSAAFCRVDVMAKYAGPQ